MEQSNQQEKDHYLTQLLKEDIKFEMIQDRCIDIAMTMHASSMGK